MKTYTRTHKNRLIYLVRPQLHMRPVIKLIKNKFNANHSFVGVEVGVAGGWNAYNILRMLNMKKLYLVDPYINPDWGDTKTESKNLLKPFNKKIEFIYRCSSDAVDLVPDDLDFVYIDAEHTYDAVKSDFECYYPKVRAGGVIGGHDFDFRSMGVIKFVLELQKKYKNVNVDSSDWWVVK